MPVTKAISIINRAKVILQDTGTTGVRYPSEELQDWLNAGQNEIIQYRPDAVVVNAQFTPTANETRQILPAAGLKLVDVTRNVGAGSNKRAVRVIERAILDDQLPMWHASNATVNVEHFVYDERDPRTFYLYPRPAAGCVLDIVYTSTPTPIALTAFDGTDVTPISVPDIYANSLLDYVLYRAFSKDAEYVENMGRATGHYAAFKTAIMGKMEGDALLATLAQANDGKAA